MVQTHPLQVKIATAHGIRFFATSSTQDPCSALHEKPSLQIDLSPLNHVKVNGEDNTISVRPGARFGDILEPLYRAGREMSESSLFCVDII